MYKTLPRSYLIVGTGSDSGKLDISLKTEDSPTTLTQLSCSSKSVKINNLEKEEE